MSMKYINKIRRLHQDEYYQTFSSQRETSFCLRPNRAYVISTLDNMGFDECFDRVSDALSPLLGPCLFKVSGRVIFSLSEFWI